MGQSYVGNVQIPDMRQPDHLNTIKKVGIDLVLRMQTTGIVGIKT
jgi:hypothetical protein